MEEKKKVKNPIKLSLKSATFLIVVIMIVVIIIGIVFVKLSKDTNKDLNLNEMISDSGKLENENEEINDTSIYEENKITNSQNNTTETEINNLNNISNNEKLNTTVSDNKANSITTNDKTNNKTENKTNNKLEDITDNKSEDIVDSKIENITNNKTEEKNENKVNDENKHTNSKENEKDNKEYCIVTFDTDGGTSISSQKVEKGSKINKPKIPTKEGFSFNAWNLNNEVFDFSTNITENIILVATWEPIYHPIISEQIYKHLFEYRNGVYYYDFDCQCWSNNVTLEIAKNSKNNIIKEVYLSNGRIMGLELPINRGETATFYCRMYVTKNGIKEYSEYRAIKGTAPVEDFNSIHLIAPSVTVEKIDENNIRLHITSNDNSDGYFVYSKSKDGTGYSGIDIGKTSIYDINCVQKPDLWQAYLEDRLYINSHKELSNGYDHTSDYRKVN